MPEIPHVFVFDGEDDEEQAGRELARRLNELEIRRPLVVSSVHGKRLASQIDALVVREVSALDGDQSWASRVGSEAKSSEADAVVAIGGGRCLDVAKLVAARAGVSIIAVPTQLSHDGICSPVAVVPNERGQRESLGAIPPRAVFISLPTLARAPDAAVNAGIGDLLANPLALRDWALAAERGLEETDARAWELSVESFELIKDSLEEPSRVSPSDRRFLLNLSEALIRSGMAMIGAGTSRPASGAEHEISHAIDQLHGGIRMHGEQVAFGCIVSMALYGEDIESFRARLKRLDLPDHPADLGLSENDMVGLVLAAPNTRPGRFTILEDANLDERSARRLVKQIWGHE